MRIVMVVALLGACSSHPSPATVDGTPSGDAAGPDLATIVATAIQQHQETPDTGVAVAVVRHGAVIYSGTFGLRDRAAAQPVTADTLFAIGSMTKGMTSYSLARAEEQGLLDLTQPIKNFLPTFQLADPTATAQSTAVDLLSHHTGLPAHELIYYCGGFTRDEVQARMPSLDWDTRPGKGFRGGYVYNNITYAAAGVALEQVTGNSWEQFIRDNVFTPVGMTSSMFTTDATSVADLAKPYAGTDELAIFDLTSVGPAGAVESTLTDMTKYLQFVMNHDITTAGTHMISEARYQRMFQPVVNVLTTPFQWDYGLGWDIFTRPNYVHYEHYGETDGYISLIAFIPALDVGFVVLVNAEGSMVPGYLENAIFGAFPDELVYQPLFATWTESTYRRVTPNVPVAPVLTATFRHPAYGDFDLYLDGNVYFMKYGVHWMKLVNVQPDAYNIDTCGQFYNVDNHPPGVLTFTRDSANVINGFTLPLIDTDVSVTFTKVPAS